MVASDAVRARSFGAVAEQYARFRPEYPFEVVSWLLPPGASRVADVGAGTGKLTGALLDLGLTIDAVEPDGEMLALLRHLHPRARAHLASAEALPLDNHDDDELAAQPCACAGARLPERAAGPGQG